MCVPFLLGWWGSCGQQILVNVEEPLKYHSFDGDAGCTCIPLGQFSRDKQYPLRGAVSRSESAEQGGQTIMQCFHLYYLNQNKLQTLDPLCQGICLIELLSVA